MGLNANQGMSTSVNIDTFMTANGTLIHLSLGNSFQGPFI